MTSTEEIVNAIGGGVSNDDAVVVLGRDLNRAAARLRELEAENARLRAQIERGRCSACDHKPHPLVCPFHPPVVVQTASGEDRSR